MLVKSICIIFITNCFAKDLTQNPQHVILHENVQPASEPSNVPLDYFDSINLPSPDYKFSYLYEQKKKDVEPQVEERDEEIGKYMNIQAPTTAPTTTTTELQQDSNIPNEKEENQNVNYGQLKTSMKLLDSHHHKHKEVTSTVPPMPPVPKLRRDQSPHLPPSYWNNLNNHRSAILANHIHRHQSPPGTLKWNKSPKSDASDLTGLHFPTHEWNPTHIRHPSHHGVHVSSTTPVTEFSTEPKLHLSTHDSRLGHKWHHEVKESPATSNILVEESSTPTGHISLAHDTKPTHDINESHRTSENPVDEVSASTELHVPSHDSQSNHLRHPNHHHIHNLPTTTEKVEDEVSTVSGKAHLLAHESPNYLLDPNHQTIDNPSPEIPVEGAFVKIDLHSSLHRSHPNILRHPIHHEKQTLPTTPETPAEESNAKFGTRLSSHASIPHHLSHHIHHEIHTSPTTPETITESLTTQSLHTNHESNQKLVPVISQHVPSLRRQNGHVKVNKIIRKVKNGPSAGHHPRQVYRGSYKFKLDDVNDMHTSPSPVRRIITTKPTHRMNNSPPPPVPTLSPWYDGYGK